MIQKTNIFSILDSPAWGGAEQYLLSNLEYLAKNQYQITLATNNKQVFNHYQHKKNWKLIKLPFRLDIIGNTKGLIKTFITLPWAFFWIVNVINSLKKKSLQTIVLTPGFSERLLFSPIYKIFKLPIIWIEFGPIKPYFKKNFGIVKMIYYLTSFLPNKIITISTHATQSMLETGYIPKQKIVKIFPGIEIISAFQLNRLKKYGQQWKAINHLQNHQLITFVGRLSKEKEVSILINAFSQVLKQSLIANELILVIIGSGPDQLQQKKLIKKLHLQKNIIFTGFINHQQRNSILSMSDLFIFPSSWELEGFGMTSLEAMMLKVPIISSGAGPQAEIITHQKTGLIFSKHIDGSNNLSQIILWALKHKKEMDYFANTAYQLVKTKFLLSQMNQKIDQLIANYKS